MQHLAESCDGAVPWTCGCCWHPRPPHPKTCRHLQGHEASQGLKSIIGGAVQLQFGGTLAVSHDRVRALREQTSGLVAQPRHRWYTCCTDCKNPQYKMWFQCRACISPSASSPYMASPMSLYPGRILSACSASISPCTAAPGVDRFAVVHGVVYKQKCQYPLEKL